MNIRIKAKGKTILINPEEGGELHIWGVGWGMTLDEGYMKKIAKINDPRIIFKAFDLAANYVTNKKDD